MDLLDQNTVMYLEIAALRLAQKVKLIDGVEDRTRDCRVDRYDRE